MLSPRKRPLCYTVRWRVAHLAKHFLPAVMNDERLVIAYLEVPH